MIFRKIAALITLTIMMAFSTLNAGSTLKDIQRHGKLVLGTSGGMAPMTRALKSGGAAGFDIDLANMMAQAMGVKLEIKVIAFNKLLDAVEDGKVDIAISNITMTPERNTQVAFVGPYFISGKCFLSKNPALATLNNIKLIDSIAVLEGSTSETFVKVLMPKVKIVTVKDDFDGAKLVEEGKVNSMLSEYPTCALILKSKPEAEFVPLFSTLTYDPIGIALKGDDAHMINWTQNFLARIKASGIMQSLAQKWLGDLITITP
ncbi:MAG: transporter substrate-binding domain-containing protein [Campylobacterota bacterium]|nr:transporter substrate-binding domain-containing protein [Campylobacterota bacterium]